MLEHRPITDDVPDSERVLTCSESLILIAAGICIGFVVAMFVPGAIAC